MSEPFLALLISTVLGLTGATLRKFAEHEKRSDQIELRLIRDYVTKEDFKNSNDRVYHAINRFEDKLDHLLCDRRHDGSEY